MFDYEYLEKIKKYMDYLSKSKEPSSGKNIDVIKLKENPELIEMFKKLSILIDTILKSYSKIVNYKKNDESEDEVEIELNNVKISSEPISVFRFTKIINENIKGYKLKTSDISKWLVKNGYLDEVINKEHQKFKSLNEKSYGIGLTSIEKENYIGEKYQTILYTEKAQKFIIDNLEKIINKDI